MEEGPEPHEFVEQTVEHHQHGHEHKHTAEGAHRATTISAITAAVLAVCAALGSLLSGRLANEAILHQSRASDQWAYFQSKSTKGHIYEVGRQIVSVLAEGQGDGESGKIKSALDDFEKQVKKYEQEKAEIEESAKGLEEESRRELAKHESFALGVAAFQVGIVLASISILVRYRALWLLSLLGGALGIGCLVTGLLQH